MRNDYFIRPSPGALDSCGLAAFFNFTPFFARHPKDIFMSQTCLRHFHFVPGTATACQVETGWKYVGNAHGGVIKNINTYETCRNKCDERGANFFTYWTNYKDCYCKTSKNGRQRHGSNTISGTASGSAQCSGSALRAKKVRNVGLHQDPIMTPITDVKDFLRGRHYPERLQNVARIWKNGQNGRHGAGRPFLPFRAIFWSRSE